VLKGFIQTHQNYVIAAVVLVFWALLFLPNLRTNPNWYGDEGIVLEEAWTLSQGHPRYGAMEEDFLSPNPHPPIYLLILGGALKLFGNDILVGRALQVLVALATAGLLFWVGFRLGGKKFGVLCVAAFLCYPEVAIHYRWVRGHPMQGMWILASIGFLICYIQEKRIRDVILAGLMCSLAVGSHYFAFPLMGIVVITAFIVDRRHIPLAAISSGLFVAVFLLWFIFIDPNGWENLLARISGASQQGFSAIRPSWFEEVFRIYRLFVEFAFLTPTLNRDGTAGIDFWILIASLGMIFFPFARYRPWLLFWLVALMLGVFSSRNTVGLFLYQAFGFIPLLAIGFAGAMVQLGDRIAPLLPSFGRVARYAPAILLIGGLGLVSLEGSFRHFDTKIDRWTVRSWQDAEETMAFVNANTTAEDFVVMPDQLFWLYSHPRKAQLIQCAHFGKGIEENLTQGVSLNQYWFDCSIENAKYLVLAYGVTENGVAIGIDAIFWMGYEGPRMIIEDVQKAEWPIVFRRGEYMVIANPRFLPGASAPNP